MFKQVLTIWIFLLLVGTNQASSENLTWTYYPTLKEYQKYQKYLVERYPHLVKDEVIGRSHEGRPLTVMKICAHQTCGRKPAIWVDGGIHGNELISPAAVTFLLKELVENNEDHRDLTRFFDWFILPITNPDGYKRKQRKNRNQKYSNKCPDKFGVDLNRNFGYLWKDDRESANDVCSNGYHGNSAFSEPESRAVRDFLLRHRERILITNSVHAQGEKLVIPWGDTNQKFCAEKKLKQLLKAGLDAMGNAGRGWKIGNVKQMYGFFAHGGFVNWAAGLLRVKYPFVTELVSDDYQQTPPEYRILPEVKNFIRFSLGLAKKAQTLMLFDLKE